VAAQVRLVLQVRRVRQTRLLVLWRRQLRVLVMRCHDPSDSPRRTEPLV
jgi:hypothetical protein